jgi:DNA-binding NtrC family response regulator
MAPGEERMRISSGTAIEETTRDDAALSAEWLSSTPRTARQRARVLIVDDDQAMRDFLEESLRDEGYTVVTSGNTLSAIVALLRDAADVVVVDWKMPDVDGFGLLAAVRRCQALLPVIFVTAYARPEVRRRALDAGAFSFLPKPFRVRDLITEIERARAAARRDGGC